MTTKTFMLAGVCVLASAFAGPALAQIQDSRPQYSTPAEQAQTRALNQDAVDGTEQSPAELNGDDSGGYPQSSGYGGQSYPQQGSYGDRDQYSQYPAQYQNPQDENQSARPSYYANPQPQSGPAYDQQMQQYRDQQMNYEDQRAQYQSDSAQYRQDLNDYDRAMQDDDDDGPY